MPLPSGGFIHTQTNERCESTQTLVDRRNAILLIAHSPAFVGPVSTGVKLQLLSLLEENYVRKSRSPLRLQQLQFLANLPNNQMHPMYVALL